jgi:Rps23 Pro-64 3,4-dihydroxylase Tpa1-like proline 4-hydroxylase
MVMAASTAAPFEINPALDAALLATRFASGRRIHIGDFLAPECAARLHEHLAGNGHWRRIVNSGEKIFEAASEDFDAMPADQRAALDAAIYAAAASGFQYRYDMIRVADEPAERRRSATLLDDFAAFMSSHETLAFLREISGASEIVFADAQATRYRPGDFLTRHDDDVAGKHRSLAYVMNLSRDWRAEWGGLLLFNGADGGIVETMVPRFNALCLFAVPQSHSVSYVAPYAAAPRLSVTGWLRSDRP